MAETPSGWLKPGDLSEGGRARRALRLLGDYLDEDQQQQAQEHGAFLLQLRGHFFWIPLEGTPWCAFADDGRVVRYCIAPDKRAGMPEGDVALTYLLWIKFDPDGFLREANSLSTKTIDDWPDSESELVRTLARITRTGVFERSRPRKVKGVVPRKPKRPELALDADKISAIFERHGKTAPAHVLRKLSK